MGSPEPTRGAHPRGPPAHPRGPSGWAHAGPKWVGPRWAQVRAPTGPKWVGPHRAQVGGPKPEIWDPTKIQKIKILKIQIRSAQNVGKVWISRKHPPGPIWAHLGPFFAWAGKIKKLQHFTYFPWWAYGPYSPGLGRCCNKVLIVASQTAVNVPEGSLPHP